MIGDSPHHQRFMSAPPTPTVEPEWQPGDPYDGPGFPEVEAKILRQAIDLLGLALIDQGHQWTLEEWGAFDEADRLLKEIEAGPHA